MTWWFDVDSKNPRKNTGYVFNSLFLSDPGSNWRRDQFEFRSFCLLLCIHSLTAALLAQLPRSIMQRPVHCVCGRPGMHGELGGSPQQIPR